MRPAIEMNKTARNPRQADATPTPKTSASTEIIGFPFAGGAIQPVQTRLSLPGIVKHVAQIPQLASHMILAHEPLVEAKPCTAPPVIFVHGYQANHATFLLMKRYFQRQGLQRLYALKLNVHRGFENMASQLQAFVQRVRAVNGLAEDAPIDLVAHSLGGLVSRWALLDANFAAGVRTLVTLGTPHFGTQIATLLFSDLGQAMRPHSPVISRLTRQLAERGDAAFPRLVCIWSRGDVFVIPASSGQLPGAENIEMSRCTHYDYLLHPYCWRRVYGSLAR